MKTLAIVAGCAAAVMASSAALAGPRAYEADGYGYGAAYGGAPGQYLRTTAKVVDVQPIYRSVAVSRPRQECWDERVVYRDARYDNQIAAGSLIGAVAGGVLGHQLGGGSGRAAATAVGAVIGASIGAGSAAANTPRSHYAGYEQRCRMVPETAYEPRIAAYDVRYRYQGRIYRTQLPYDPGSRIDIDVDVRPVAY